MEHLTTLMSNPELTALVNTQVLCAVLLALLIYRLLIPVIDIFNPVYLLFGAVRLIYTALMRKPQIVGVGDYQRGHGGARPWAGANATDATAGTRDQS